MTIRNFELHDGEKSKEVNQLLIEQAKTYVVDSIVESFDKGWDPTAEPEPDEVKQKAPKTPLTDEEKQAARLKLDQWARENNLLTNGESLLVGHEFSIGRTYRLHWVWKEVDGVTALYLGNGETAEAISRLPAKPTADGKADLSRAFRIRQLFNDHVAEVADGVEIAPFVNSWEAQLGVNGAFSTVYVDMLYRYSLASNPPFDVDALDKYMMRTLPTKSLMNSRDPENWEAAAAFAVISGALDMEQAQKSYMLDRSVKDVRMAVGEAIRKDGFNTPLKFADDIEKRAFFEKYVTAQTKVSAVPGETSKDFPTTDGMTAILDTYLSAGQDITACFDTNARFWGRMVIADYYERRTIERRMELLERPESSRELVAQYVMAEIVLMTTFRCLPGSQMMTNIQALPGKKLLELVAIIKEKFQGDIEELAAKKK